MSPSFDNCYRRSSFDMESEAIEDSTFTGRNEFGHSSLVQSIIHEGEDEFDRILSREEVMYERDESGFDPMQMIVILGKENLISDESLWRYKTFLDHQERLPSLFHLGVLHSSRLSFLQRLGRLNFEVNCRIPSSGQTPLHLAVILGKQEMVSTLLSCGASPSLQDRKGRSAMDLARENKQDDLVKLMSNRWEPPAVDNLYLSPALERIRQISISSISTIYSMESENENPANCFENITPNSPLFVPSPTSDEVTLNNNNEQFDYSKDMVSLFPLRGKQVASWLSTTYGGPMPLY